VGKTHSTGEKQYSEPGVNTVNTSAHAPHDIHGLYGCQAGAAVWNGCVAQFSVVKRHCQSGIVQGGAVPVLFVMDKEKGLKALAFAVGTPSSPSSGKADTHSTHLSPICHYPAGCARFQGYRSIRPPNNGAPRPVLPPVAPHTYSF
jgi:hypothetical protein